MQSLVLFLLAQFQVDSLPPPRGFVNDFAGVIPAATMLVAAMELGAKQARLVRYATSGDISGDRRQVVAYAALTVS